MIESIVLGAVQGVAEWLPVSSEAMIILVKNNFFPTGEGLGVYINQAIFLHMGTLVAAVIYFREKLLSLVKSAFAYQRQDKQTKANLTFIVIATAISGVVGMALLSLVERYASFFENQTLINYSVGAFLFITAFLLYLSERKVQDKEKIPEMKDSLITGVVQGFSAIPGVSRSGSSIAIMGLLGFSKQWALEMSFILSIPLVFFANLILNYKEFLSFTLYDGVALLSAFVFGYATIAGLLAIAQKVRFSSFVAFFALLVVGVTMVTSL